LLFYVFPLILSKMYRICTETNVIIGRRTYELGTEESRRALNDEIMSKGEH